VMRDVRSVALESASDLQNFDQSKWTGITHCLSSLSAANHTIPLMGELWKKVLFWPIVPAQDWQAISGEALLAGGVLRQCGASPDRGLLCSVLWSLFYEPTGIRPHHLNTVLLGSLLLTHEISGDTTQVVAPLKLL
jgi:hypothetical protein